MKTAIVTGANSGVGLALCDRLLTLYPEMQLCMVCRNEERAQVARKLLLYTHSGANIRLVLCDVGCLKSVPNAASQIKNMFDHVDYLFLNAGVMPSPKVHWWNVMTTFLMPWKMVERFTTGRDLLIVSDENTEEGFRTTFATNVLGHFYMVQELLDVLGGERSSQIIWTSSRNANGNIFSLEDLQHKICCAPARANHPFEDQVLELADTLSYINRVMIKHQSIAFTLVHIDPYASSKYLEDTVSIEMNEQLRNRNIYTQTTCPGLVMTGLTQGILPSSVWSWVEPFAKCLRFLVPSLTWEPHNACEALVWLTKQDVAGLDSRAKYLSSVSALGYPYCSISKITARDGEPAQAYKQLVDLIKTSLKPEL